MLFLPQMELKAGKGAGDRTGPDWKAALQREREEQQHLLAESYSAVMELTRQLQISEHNWAQEKLQLVERLQGEKQQVEQQLKELQNRLSQVRPVPAPAALSHKRGVAMGTDQREDSFRYCWIRVLRDRGGDQVFLPAGLIGLLSVCFIPKQAVLQCGLFEFCVLILTA